MAAAPVYYTTPKVGHCRLTTGIANTDGSGASTALSWFTGSGAPSADYMLVKVIVAATNATGTANLADCLLHMFVDDGTTIRLVKTFDLGDQAVGTVALSAGQWEITFPPGEWCFPSAVLPEFAVSVTPTAGNVDVVVLAHQA